LLNFNKIEIVIEILHLLLLKAHLNTTKAQM